jgi:hypothetical protein
MATPKDEVSFMALGGISEYSSEELTVRARHLLLTLSVKGASYARFDIGKVPAQVHEAGYQVMSAIDITLQSGQKLILFERSQVQ